jgi:hypothetical protein
MENIEFYKLMQQGLKAAMKYVCTSDYVARVCRGFQTVKNEGVWHRFGYYVDLSPAYAV